MSLLLSALALCLPPAGQPLPEVEGAAPVPEHKPYKETIPDSEVSFEMVPIPGGTFVMGSPETETGRNADEGPQHPVAIRPFWMGKYEVSWDEFDLFRKEMGVEHPDQNDMRLKNKADAITGPTPPYVDESYGHGREGFPALCMTHHAAMEYCRWLSNKTKKVYRLPTEAEWEYAARAGTKTTYFFGDDPKDLGEYAWFAGNSEETTHKCGTKKPNPWGLHDMYGNLLEWCLDHSTKDYKAFALDKPTLCPVTLPTDARFPHVARGGSWNDPEVQCRSAARRTSDKTWLKFDPQRPQSIWWLTKIDYIGFRVVRAEKEQDNLKGLRSKVTRQSPNYGPDMP
jgi:formylglycine-generating enzyme required for sulfatase activity